MRNVAVVLLTVALATNAVARSGGSGGGHGGGHSGGRASFSVGHASHVRSVSRYTSRFASSRAGYVVAGDDHSVRSYYRKDGTFVQAYHATNPNGTRNDNYSTRGNINPYTGVEGSKPRDGEP